ncbi:MAG: cache domain-containing protein [Syntrophomonadaceae bacterium]|nr:cache domain-containing protein [Syntrophomonadaceae bacterium]
MVIGLNGSKERELDVRIQITVLLSLIITAIIVSIGIYAVMVFTERIEHAAKQKLISDLTLGEQIMELNYPGPWHLVNGHLYKGMTLMEERHEMLDHIGQLTGDTVTVFRGDTRVSTNVTQENIRLINTQVYDEVKKAVLINGETYLGSAIVVGTKNFTAYKPIKNSSGKIIGIWYMGVPSTPYDKAVSEFRNNMIVYSALGIFLIILFTLLLVYLLYKPVFNNVEAFQTTGDDRLCPNSSIPMKDINDYLDAIVNVMKEKISKLNGDIGAISPRVHFYEQLIDELREKSQKIMPSVDLITNIARQTNFLAWDAANEASEVKNNQGKRFMVAADEMRKLAEESGYAAKQIGDLINELQNIIIEAATQAASGNPIAPLDINGEPADQMAGIEEINASIDGLNQIIEALEEAIGRFKI